MDKLLPRLSLRSLRTFSTLLSLHPDLYSRYSSSYSSACSSSLPSSGVTLSHKAQIFFSTKDNYLLRFPSLRNYSSTASEPTMEKNPKDVRNEEAIKQDQQREGYAKRSCDPSNTSFDQILPHLLNIYESRGSAKDFEIYALDATFEDPLMRAQGVKQIKSAFYSIPKVFSESRIVEYSIKENIISPGNKEILMDNKQYYKFMGRDINMISLIKLQLKDGKIVRHEDLWDKKPLRNRETVQLPLVGRILEMTRRGSMLATHALMGFGKDPAASM